MKVFSLTVFTLITASGFAQKSTFIENCETHLRVLGKNPAWIGRSLSRPTMHYAINKVALVDPFIHATNTREFALGHVGYRKRLLYDVHFTALKNVELRNSQNPLEHLLASYPPGNQAVLLYIDRLVRMSGLKQKADQGELADEIVAYFKDYYPDIYNIMIAESIILAAGGNLIIQQ